MLSLGSFVEESKKNDSMTSSLDYLFSIFVF